MGYFILIIRTCLLYTIQCNAGEKLNLKMQHHSVDTDKKIANKKCHNSCVLCAKYTANGNIGTVTKVVRDKKEKRKTSILSAQILSVQFQDWKTSHYTHLIPDSPKEGASVLWGDRVICHKSCVPWKMYCINGNMDDLRHIYALCAIVTFKGSNASLSRKYTVWVKS